MFSYILFIRSLSLFCFALGGVRPIKSSSAGVSPQESTDWLEMMWAFAASLVAPDEEEEGIHHLTESLTCKKTSPDIKLTVSCLTAINNSCDAHPA